MKKRLLVFGSIFLICLSLFGCGGGGIMTDKFEGGWYLIQSDKVPRFIKFKKLADGKYAFADCALYILYDKEKGNYYFTTGEFGGIFSIPIETHHIYEFANEKKNTIVDTDKMLVPDARERYYYDNEKKVLLDKVDKAYLPMGEGSKADEALKKAYDVLIDDLKKKESLKGNLPSFEDYQADTKRILDEKLQKEEQYYKRMTR